MLSQLHRRAAYLVLALLFISGAAHVAIHQFGQIEGEFGLQPSPLEHPLRVLHGAAAMASLILIGSVLAPHALRFLRLGRNRVAGLAFFGLMTVLVITGFALYYAGGDTLRPLARGLHLVAGFLALPAFLVHLLRGTRTPPR